MAVGIVSPPAGWSAEAEVAAKAPEIAVLRFYNRAANPWWDTVGADRAQRALTALLIEGQPRLVMSREQLGAALAERKVWLTGELSPAAATKLGRQLRLKFLVAGTLVEYGTGATASSQRRGRKLLGLGGPKDFKVELLLRLLDGSTGATVWSDSRRDQAPLRDVVQQTEGGDGSAEAAIFEQLLLPIIESLGAGLAQAISEMNAEEPPETTAPVIEESVAQGDDGRAIR